jgi:hypothetical protein
VSTNVALDGVMEAPDRWFFRYWSDELAKVAHDELLRSDALLLGRVGYEPSPSSGRPQPSSPTSPSG